MPKISVVVPTFNSAKTLGEALNSFRRQGWPDLEVVVVDGASSDETMSLVRANSDLIAKWVSEPDKGIYDAINKGLNLATGELIAVVGSDDTLLDDAIREIVAIWSRTRTDIIAGRAMLSASAEGGEIRPDESYGVGALLSGIPFCHNAMFVTRQAYQRVGMYDLRYRICADAHWVHRAIRLGCSCTQIDTPVVRFSLHGASSTDAIKIMEETFDIIAGNFTNLSIADAEVIFRAVRGWSNGSDVDEVLMRHRENPELLLSAAVAFLQRSQRLASSERLLPAGISQAIPPIKSRRSRFLRKLFADTPFKSRFQ